MNSDDTLGRTDIRALMTQPVVTIGRNARCDEALAAMERHGIRHLPVVEAGLLVGIVCRHDLSSALGFVMGYGERGRDKLLHALLVKEVMREGLVTITPGESASEAARRLLDHRIGCLPVVEEGRPVGIVTTSDLLRLLATPTCDLAATGR